MDWQVHTDGGARGNPGPAAAGIVILDAKGTPHLEAGLLLGRLTNNQAEYRALLVALHLLARQPQCTAVFHTDSELLVRQLLGEYRAKDPQLRALRDEAQMLLLRLDGWQIRHVGRGRNRRADQLLNQALDEGRHIIATDRLGLGPVLEEMGLAGLKSPPARRTARGGNHHGAPSGEAGVVAAEGTVRVTVVRRSRRRDCPLSARKGEQFLFGTTLPAGFCVRGAVSVLDAIIAMQDARRAGSADIPAMTVRCREPACGAEFSLECGADNDT